MVRVLDYSAGFPRASEIVEAGFSGAVRYIGQPLSRKNTTERELEDFRAHGLGMALVFEWAAGDWRGGYSAGRQNAIAARTHADTIGFPSSRPIYFAVDQDVTVESEFRQVTAYLQGAGSVLGSRWVGVYGEHDVCVRAAQPALDGAPPAAWFWQCRAWSGTPVRLYGGRHLYQHAEQLVVDGVTCDVNDVLQADWGQHDYEPAPVAAEEDERSGEMANFFSFEFLDGPRQGQGVFVDMINDRTFWADPRALEASAERARTYHLGVNATHGEVFLAMYGRGNNLGTEVPGVLDAAETPE